MNGHRTATEALIAKMEAAHAAEVERLTAERDAYIQRLDIADHDAKKAWSALDQIAFHIHKGQAGECGHAELPQIVYDLVGELAGVKAERDALYDLAHAGIDAEENPVTWKFMAEDRRLARDIAYAERDALEARCAGLERKIEALDKENIVMRRQMELLIDERDAARSSLDKACEDYRVLSAHLDKSRANHVHACEARDAWKTRAERAEAIIYDEAVDHRAHGFCYCPLCKFADAISGHAPATL